MKFPKSRNYFNSRFKKRKTHKSLRRGKTGDQNYRIITEEEPLSVAAEHFRRVKVNLDFLSVDQELKVVQVTSAVMGEGKTTALLNIVTTYVETGKKVLIVDLDLRRPKLHRAFRLENKKGLTNYLTDEISIDEAIKHTDKKIDVLNAGSKVTYPTALLGSDALAQLISELKEKYDIIFLDCPPVLSVTDTCITSRITDGTLIVVSQRISDKNEVKVAVQTLRQNNVNILGIVFTEVAKNGASYGYHYYGYSYN